MEEEFFKKYESELYNYKYCDSNNLSEIIPGSRIKYFLKNNNNYRRTGIFEESYLNHSIFKLHSVNKKYIWRIYTDKYIFFYKVSHNSNLKYSLKKLLDSNFTIKK
jgi:hypothetical protein